MRDRVELPPFAALVVEDGLQPSVDEPSFQSARQSDAASSQTTKTVR